MDNQLHEYIHNAKGSSFVWKGWHIKFGEGRKISGYIAWAGRQPLTGNGPIDEPQKDIWFEFGKTDIEAVQKLIAGLPQGE